MCRHDYESNAPEIEIDQDESDPIPHGDYTTAGGHADDSIDEDIEDTTVEDSEIEEIAPSSGSFVRPLGVEQAEGKIAVFVKPGRDSFFVLANDKGHVEVKLNSSGVPYASPGYTPAKWLPGIGYQQITGTPAVSPDSTEARTNRLSAAEQDTGYSLKDRVGITGCGSAVKARGTVVGFARINDLEGIHPGEPKRGVVVKLDVGLKTADSFGFDLGRTLVVDPYYLSKL